MRKTRRSKRIIPRLFFWVIYISSGIILYNSKVINTSILYFLKIFYPLSIFWVQVRFTNKENWLPVNKNMSSAQLWFRLIPIFCSLFTVLGTIFNTLYYLFMNNMHFN